jgi:uncharacterized membrane protein YGL010W
MRTLNQWLNEYGESHKNETNKLIHWICVPAIFFSIMGLLYCIKLPWLITNGLELNVAMIVLLLTTIYYLSLSIQIGMGMLLFGILCLALCYVVENFLSLPLWGFSIIIFIVAWIGQFYGHKVEGKKPSFFKDLQFLLIGPAWLMSFVYKKMGIPLHSKQTLVQKL